MTLAETCKKVRDKYLGEHGIFDVTTLAGVVILETKNYAIPKDVEQQIEQDTKPFPCNVLTGRK